MNKKHILTITLFTLMSILNACMAEELCHGSGYCFDPDELKGIHLFLNGHSEASAAFQHQLQQASKRGKFIGCFESIDHNDDDEEKCTASQAGGFYGIEHPFVSLFVDILESLEDAEQCIQNPLDTNCSEMGILRIALRYRNANILEGFMLNPYRQQIWVQFINSQKKLSKQFSPSFLQQLKTTIATSSESTFGKLSRLKDYPEGMLRLRKLLGRYLLDNIEQYIEKEDAHKLDYEKIRAFLKNPSDPVYQRYVEQDVNLNWRGMFINRNLKPLLKKAFEENIPLAISIGVGYKGHMKALLEDELEMDYYIHEYVAIRFVVNGQEGFVHANPLPDGTTPLTGIPLNHDQHIRIDFQELYKHVKYPDETFPEMILALAQEEAALKVTYKGGQYAELNVRDWTTELPAFGKNTLQYTVNDQKDFFHVDFSHSNGAIPPIDLPLNTGRFIRIDLYQDIYEHVKYPGETFPEMIRALAQEKIALRITYNGGQYAELNVRGNEGKVTTFSKTALRILDTLLALSNTYKRLRRFFS